MKYKSLLILSSILVTFQLHLITLASPTKSGIGDGYIYPVTKLGTKPKTTTTYYAKPLHPPAKKPHRPPKPKPIIYKVLIQNQPASNAQPTKEEQIFKIITFSKHGAGSGGGKSAKIFKIIHVKQDHSGDWSK